jgi:adenylate cyclase
MSLFSELKRRNVIRMAGLYLVGAWVIVQIAETLFPAFDVPNWVLRAIVIVLALGFIPALVFSWLFELTPDGLKRDGEVTPAQSIASTTARRMNQLTLAGVLLVVVLFAVDRFWPQATSIDTTKDTSAPAVVGGHAGSDSAKAPEHSIAVLPFVNMSGEADNEYFSDGISEEILNVLANTPALQVAARTSSFSFKGKDIEIPEIARELHVRLVLEGSVRKQGDQVRITAQLVDAESGFHRWSQTYDRKLQDIFAIQDEISQAIASELQVRLVSRSKAGSSSAGTENLAAYDLYLRGQGLWQTRGEDQLWQAVDLLKQAVAADPKFAAAHGGLALVYVVLPEYSGKIGFDEADALAADAAEMALALDPMLPEAYAALARLAARERRHRTAIALLRQAIAQRPSFATAYQWLGLLLATAGDRESGLAALNQAVRLDPRSMIAIDNRAVVLLALGRNDEAYASCAELIEQTADFKPCLMRMGMAKLQGGDPEAARGLYERVAKLHNPGALPFVAALIDALAHDRDRASVAQRLANFDMRSSLRRDSGNIFSSIEIPSLLVLLGEPELALDHLEKLAENEGAGIVPAEFAMLYSALDPLRCTSRYAALAKRLRITDLRAASQCTTGEGQ